MKRKNFSCIDSILVAIIFVCFLIYLLVACSTVQPQPAPSLCLRDSTHTVVKERIMNVQFEVDFHLPEQSTSRTTLDSLSHLETDYAESDVHLHPDGSFTHTLSNKQTSAKRQVDREISVRDTLTTRLREVPVYVPQPYPVEKPLTKWDTILIDLGGFSLLLFMIWAIYKFLILVRKIK